MTRVELAPALPSSGPTPGPHSRWVGELDLPVEAEQGLLLRDAEGFSIARLLVRDAAGPQGFVDVPIEGGRVDGAVLAAALAAADLARTPPAVPGRPQPMSIVLCTRDRPDQLPGALRSILAMEDADFELVVVDNASRTTASADVVRAMADPRIRLVSEPRPGLARARNRGVLEARHEIVAFTDDDVAVDRRWLVGLRDGFAAAEDVACVCGMVPSGELRTYAQAYFDGRVTWARSCLPRVYDLADPPRDQPLFPFQVGQFGTGANFAMKREAILALGGFDEALGVGSPTRGGEDIDMFVRVLLAGRRLVYQPSAFVWHRHRSDPAALREQIEGYGVGLGAWIAKLVVDPRTLRMVMPRAARAVAHALRMTRVDLGPGGPPQGAEHLALRELSGAASGPYRYARARLSGARSTPLTDAGRAGAPEGGRLT